MLQRESYAFDPTRGYLHKQDWRGLGRQEMIALQNAYALSGIACEIINELGIWSLVVDDTTQQYTIDSWQLVANEENLNILEHPTIQQLVGIYGDQLLSVIQYFASNINPENNTSFLISVLEGTATVAINGTNYSLNLSDADALTVGRFYSLYQRGTTDYRQSQYVLRHTTNAPNRYLANISDVNVNFIYSTAELLTEVTSAALWIYPLPFRLQYKINSIPVQSPVTANDIVPYEWGWLKSSSTETTAANNRIDISTDYTLALWETLTYPEF